MGAFRFEHLPAEQGDSARWTIALLNSIAREEARGRIPKRLTEAGLATWRRFKGRLTTTDFVELLFEDAAVLHRIPFSAAEVSPGFATSVFSEEDVSSWIEIVAGGAELSPAPQYIEQQAKLLQLPTKLARADLHVVKAHQKVLELPGLGGQLTNYILATQSSLNLQSNFIIAAHTWSELVLAGIISVELGAPNSDGIVRASPDDLRQSTHPLRQRSFDFVIGLHPDKGGLFRIENQLEIWFPTAKVLLV